MQTSMIATFLFIIVSLIANNLMAILYGFIFLNTFFLKQNVNIKQHAKLGKIQPTITLMNECVRMYSLIIIE